MGSSASKIANIRRCSKRLWGSLSSKPPVNSDDLQQGLKGEFLQPYRDPRAGESCSSFPLDDVDLPSASDDDLARAFFTAPRLYEYDGVSVVRLSESLVIKGGEDISSIESRNVAFAAEALHLPVPKVHCTFTADVPSVLDGGKCVKGNFIVMEYVPGPIVEECWDGLDSARQQSVAVQVAAIIETMQRVPLDLPPGPIGGTDGCKFEGPWFTDYGGGPFATLQELEDWCNHKIDVCIQFKQLPKDAPRFAFRSVVFTHQDIALRNLILDAQEKVWLVDWAFAGAYPPGFEQAVLPTQSTRAFADMVLQRLPDRQEQVMAQFALIAYGLSVAARLWLRGRKAML